MNSVSFYLIQPLTHPLSRSAVIIINLEDAFFIDANIEDVGITSNYC